MWGCVGCDRPQPCTRTLARRVMHMPPSLSVEIPTVHVYPSSSSAVCPCRARWRLVGAGLYALLGLLSLLLPLPAWAGIDEAIAAQARGDYTTAVQEV